MSRPSSLASSKQGITPSPILKIVILGDGNVGKSSLMTRYVRNEFDARCAHTVGVEFLRKDICLPNTGERFSSQIWDTAGQERFRCLQRPFYRGTDICMLVFSVDDRKSLESLASWILEFQKYAEVDAARFPFVVIGNKIDVDEDRRQVSADEAKSFCHQLQQNLLSSPTSFPPLLPFPYLESSAKDKVNVEEAFVAAVSYMKELKCLNSPSNMNGAGGVIKLEPVNLRKVMKKGAKPCC